MSAQPDRTAQILEQAGWAKGSDGIYAKGGERLSLTVEVVTGWTDYITAIDTMASQAKAAGIELRAAQSSWNEWTQKKGSGQFQLVIDSLGQGPAPDPYYLYTYFFDSTSGAKVGQDAGNNFSRYTNVEVDTALDKLATLPLDGQAARQPYFATIQQAIVRDMPYVPVLAGGTTSIWNTAKFSGWPSDEDQYAFPAVWSALDAAEVFKRLAPKS
jgi:peptide/nickel transport system substrate-binding protein